MKIIEHHKLDSLIEWTKNYREDQLFMGLTCMKPGSIPIVKEELSILNSKLRIYITELENYSKGFPEDYATNDNDCFKNDKERFKNLRGSYNFLVDFILKCCPSSPRLAYNHNGVHITYSNVGHSYFCNTSATQFDLFGRESYPEDVQQLCQEFNVFFQLITRADGICKDVLEVEERIRQNPLLCERLYYDSYDLEAATCMDSINSLKDCKDIVFPDRFEDSRKTGTPCGTIYTILYHVLNKREFHNHVVNNELKIARKLGMQDEELVLFKGMQLEQVLQRRYVIMNFDKVAYCSRENTLASECIAFFIEWNGILEGKAKLCYDYFQKNYQGTYEIPSYTAVSKALKQKVGTGGSAHMESYDDFASKLNALMDKFTPVEKRKMAQTSAFLPNMLALR